MEEYQFLTQKVFEKTKDFEKRLDEKCQTGWKPISIAGTRDGLTVLLQRVDRYENY